MTDYANTSKVSIRFYHWCIALITTWMTGLLSGCVISEPFSFHLMRSALLQPVSIVGLLGCIFLPLLLTYFALSLDKTIIILIVCYIKAAAYGFNLALLSRMFDSSAWLVRTLFLFSDSCVMILLFLLWLHYFATQCRTKMANICVCTAIGFGIALADYYMISPILMGLF